MKRSVASMFRIFIILFALICASCSSDEDSGYSGKPLNITSYRETKCWLRNGRILESFVIFTEANNGRWPLFVSDRCMLVHRIFDFKGSILSFPSAFPVDGDGGVAQSALMTNYKILSNTVDHLPAVDATSEVFYITAEVENIGGEYSGVFHISKVKSLNKIDIGVEDFMNLSIAERRALDLR